MDLWIYGEIYDCRGPEHWHSIKMDKGVTLGIRNLVVHWGYVTK